MRSVALVLSALLLVSFYGEAFGQCGSWTQEEYSVNENDNLVEVTATFPTPVQVQTFLRWTTVAGSATAGAEGDYIGGSALLTFNPGDMSQSVSLFIIDDQLSEGTESFSVVLSLLDDTVCDEATVLILDDEPEVVEVVIQWEQSKYNFSESDGTVEICAAPDSVPVDPITVSNIALEDKSAESGLDFFANVIDEWVFTTDEPQCITIFIANDLNFEGTEDFCATFEQTIDGSVVTERADICILDDDPPIVIEWEFSSYTFDEGGNGIFEICAVTNDTIIGDRIEVRQVMYVNGSAIADVDFNDPDVVQEVVFQAGDSRQCIEIEILDDSLFELEECFYVNLVSEIPGVEVSTTKIFIDDDEGDVTLNVEREIYTVVEGNELEVCVVIADGGVSTFVFHVSGYFYVMGNRIDIVIYFPIGVSRMCGSALIPGNTYLDKIEREVQIYFIIVESEFSEFLSFDRDSAWVFIADDDIAFIGFSNTSYSVFESDGSVSVCVELCEGSTNRPIDICLYTEDATAIAGTNYEQTIAIATLPALAEAGDVVCVYIPILNDGLVTPTLYFSLSLDISDTHVKIPEEKQSAIVQILPAFDVCFDMDSPRVNGSELFLSFFSSVEVDQALCTVETLGTVDCTNGTALFIFDNPSRAQPYDIEIVITAGSETRTLVNDVRSELTDICDAHLVNKGIMVNGNNATINVQPTSPSMPRITDLECRCFPVESGFAPCPAGDVSDSGASLFNYIILDGCTRIIIRPINDGNCSPLRALPLDL